MLKDIQIKNFKCFQDSGKLEIKPITFLVGPNSSGKSSIFQSILALRQTVRSKDPKSPLILQDYIDLGSFKDVVWKHKSRNIITIKFSDLNTTFDVSFAYYNNTIYVNRLRSFGVLEEENKKFNFDYNITRKSNEKIGTFEYILNVVNHPSYLMGNKYRIKFYKFYQTIPNLIPPDKYLKEMKLDCEEDVLNFLNDVKHVSFFLEQQQQLENIFEKIHHIGPLRRKPLRIYTASGALPFEVGKSGEWVVDELISNPKITDVVKNWFKYFRIASNFKVEELRKNSKRYEIMIKEFHTGEWINIADVGFGASQILPIIVEGFISKESTILIEQPEIHLHPSAQATMGDLLIDIVKNKNNNLIIETHSDLIISRVCTRIAEGGIDNSDVAIYYLEPTNEGTRVRVININKDGQYENYPDGFFEERYDEAMMKADFIL